MSVIDATLSLIDEDQGVCPDGHPCGLDVSTVTGELRFNRVCLRKHEDLSVDAYDIYVGPPLTRWGLTEAELEQAMAEGAHPDVVSWAASTLAEKLW